MKVIFLDIDGPVISNGVPIEDSDLRLTHLPEAIDLLNKLCKDTGAKIVTNSNHNYNMVEGYSLKDDLITWGIEPEYFHEDWRTCFPYIDYSKVKNETRGIGRFIAIDKWHEKNGSSEWVCFDDRKFTISFRLIHITDSYGLRQEHIDKAIEVLGLSE